MVLLVRGLPRERVLLSRGWYWAYVAGILFWGGIITAAIILVWMRSAKKFITLHTERPEKENEK